MSGYEDRKDYDQSSLDESGWANDVVGRIREWLDEARQCDPVDYNAMTLSTIGEDGHPNARIVLLRSLEEIQGRPALAFYTNRLSAKGRELGRHPHAAVTFFWKELERQLRIRGQVQVMSDADSDRYFASRPRDSRIGAWASRQSEEVAGRQPLEEAWRQYDRQFGEEVPRPPHWGGYLLTFESVEFWQGRPGRMHDRLRADAGPDGWTVRRLQP